MPDLHYEKLYGWNDGKIICGVDEVGRGPLAGPVVAAALILPGEGLPPDIEKKINDSKQLSEKKREELFPLLTQTCRYAIAECSVEEIDTLNIFHATMLAMQRAVEILSNSLEKTKTPPHPTLPPRGEGFCPSSLLRAEFNDKDCRKALPPWGEGWVGGHPTTNKTNIDVALIDGNRAPKLTCQTVPIVKGDGKSLSIAAASIIAKVTRDRLMKKLALEHPGYGWEKNMGYGTAQHLAALNRLGPTMWHRQSFEPVAQLKLAV